MRVGIIDYFMPKNQAESTEMQRKQARIGLSVIFVVMFWGLTGVLSGAVTGLYLTGTVMLVGVGVLGIAPFVLRSTGDLSLTGHFVLGPVFVVLMWTIYEGGGLYGSSVVWLPVLPLLASLFQGSRTAMVWLIIVEIGFVAILAATLMGFSFPTIPSQQTADILFGVGLVGMGVTSFVLLQLKNNVQRWLSDTLRQKEAETSAVLETAPDGIITVHTDGEVLSANPAAARIFGRNREQMLDLDIGELVTTLDADTLAGVLATKSYGETLEHLGQRDSTGEFPLEIAFGRHAERLVLVLRDITERKVVSQQLRDARDAAVEANQAKSAFLARMSHELRTPLNAVIGYSEMIQEEVGAMRDNGVDNIEVVAEFLPDVGRIRAAGVHLLSLVSDILDLAKVEAGQMGVHIEAFDLADLVEDVQKSLTPLALKSNDTFEVELSEPFEPMHSDPTKVRQILYNLLSNAFKFTRDGAVTLRVVADPAQAQVVFEIEDTGVGMSNDEIEAVFEAFAQADSSTTRQFGGTGLGLTITRHFCTLLGGSIDVESTPGQGSRFRVQLAADMRSANVICQD